ncbi:MAG TPA: AAA family ATPase, partial [Steroidobacteraceae bacterium]|nr:AAA family ATPase [Steroidobacteraceae bacterium]
IAKYVHTKTDGAEQFQAAFLKVTTHDELVTLGHDERGATRYTTREMLTVERELLERGARMSGHLAHVVTDAHRDQALIESRLSAEQREAFEHVTAGADLALVIGVAGAGKSTMLETARRAWEAEGLSVKGAALSGIAAENLEHASGIVSRTLASWERAWENDRDPLTRRDVLVIDEAGLVGTRQMARVLERAEVSGAKVVLLGDPEQLQAIEAGAPFRGLSGQAGFAELTEVHRQRIGWQKQATQDLARGHTTAALTAYERAQQVAAASTRDAAREAMLLAWQRASLERPGESRLMLAYTRDDVQALNHGARVLRERAGDLQAGEIIETDRGPREFAVGDRLYFLKNERSLGVKNGTLGTLEKIRDGVLQVRLDGDADRRVAVDSRFYHHLDHGYAATVHKAQGTTVDRTFVLATPHFDRHSTYVALSRHRENVALFYGREDFPGSFEATLSRARPKALAHDYLEREGLDAERAAGSESEGLRSMSLADRFRQRMDEAAQRFALEREAERSAREVLQQKRALEQYQALERQRELVREQQRAAELRRKRDHGLEL